MDTFGAYSSDDERTLRFPYKTPEPFDRNKIYSTWLFANCRDQKGLDDMWRVGIPAKHLESSIEEVYVGMKTVMYSTILPQSCTSSSGGRCP